MEKSKLIKGIDVHHKFWLLPEIKLLDGTKQRPLSYEADFVFWDIKANRRRVIDCKGVRTQAYLLKKKLFNFMYQGMYELEETI